MPDKAKWTVLTYIAAHNNLDPLGRKSLLEIVNVGSTRDVIHGVLYDGPAGAGRYVVGEPGKAVTQERLGSFDSGDPDGLIAAAEWLFGRHPAERYGLVLWSHGSGWEPGEIEAVAKEARPGAEAGPEESKERAAAPGSRALFRTTLRSLLEPDTRTERAILFDDGTGHSLDTIELARVAGAIAGFVGRPLELIGMDACLMGNIEVAYELRHAVRHLAASEELVPGHSWPYGEIFSALNPAPDMTGADLARLVVERYVAYYTAKPPAAGDVTKVALDLSRIEELARAAGALAEALRAGMATQAGVLWAAQQLSQARETRSGKRKPTKFDYHLWDLRSVAAGLEESAAAAGPVRDASSAVVRALVPGAGAVLAEGHRGDWFDGTGGVSVYVMPPGTQRLAPAYATLAFAKDTRWDETLSAYHQTLA
jgi:hypothetical protein